MVTGRRLNRETGHPTENDSKLVIAAHGKLPVRPDAALYIPLITTSRWNVRDLWLSGCVCKYGI